MKTSHIISIKGKKNGPQTVILGSSHGNERIGAAIIKRLALTLHAKDLKGTLHLILGNPKAYQANKRFIDTDLNRLFGENFSLLKNGAGNYEEKRAMEIAPFLAQADYLLDIHSTIKPSVPFVYTEITKEHLKLAHLFDTKFIVSASLDFQPRELVSSADNFVDQHGGIGLTYESGWHKDASVFKMVLEKTKQYLHEIGMIEYGAYNNKKNIPQHLVIYSKITVQTADFKFKKDYMNFDSVKKGQTLAKNAKESLKAPENSFIIFPKKDLQIGNTACYLAKIFNN